LARFFSICYRQAYLIIGLVLLLTLWAGLQVKSLQIEVSSDALLSKNSGLIREYEIIRSQFGSDEVIGIYIRDEALFALQTQSTTHKSF
jgi:predicted RND superfamily exporter protein